MWKYTKLFELKNNRFARTSGWINNDRIEFIVWIISLSPWRAMCMSTVTVLWIPMHLQIFTHTHTHTHTRTVCQRMGGCFWQGELHASCKWWMTSLRTNSEGQTRRTDTVSLCLSFTTIAFILLFYVHKTRGHSFNRLWHNGNIFQITECKASKECFFCSRKVFDPNTQPWCIYCY